jgi:hypothetical protein
VGRPDRVEQVRWNVGVDVGQGGDDHGVDAGEAIETVIRLQPESADPDRPRTADREVVPGIGQTGGVEGEDLAGHSQFEVQHLVGSSDTDRAHVRNCTGRGVPDTGLGIPLPQGCLSLIFRVVRRNP